MTSSMKGSNFSEQNFDRKTISQHNNTYGSLNGPANQLARANIKKQFRATS